ncbi:helix-turn-helix domain-containing protein [Alphaproteobacteria bacterium]|nr:helix-turn-helix domain-containing protein [Alphaproteobacteria bacterium]
MTNETAAKKEDMKTAAVAESGSPMPRPAVAEAPLQAASDVSQSAEIAQLAKTASPAPQGYGHLFAQRREQLKIPLDQVARNLRIQIRYLKALEENDFKNLPERVFTLGFIRSYASYLDMDGLAFVKRYRPVVDAHLPESYPKVVKQRRLNLRKNAL